MKNGRIAVPSEAGGGLEGKRSGHFGHCSVFTLIDVEDGEVKNIGILPNVEHNEGGCLVPVNLLASNGVNALIVAGMGARPLNGFIDAGIDVYFEAQQPEVGAVVNDLLAGKLPKMEAQQACGGGGAH